MKENHSDLGFFLLLYDSDNRDREYLTTPISIVSKNDTRLTLSEWLHNPGFGHARVQSFVSTSGVNVYISMSDRQGTGESLLMYDKILRTPKILSMSNRQGTDR